jgi:hypothetical protein
MSSLTALEKRTLERLFEMGSGYVLNFSNRTFQEFVLDTVRLDIFDAKYEYGSGSKANRLRGFWTVEPDHVVAALLAGMLAYAKQELTPDADFVGRTQLIVDRLRGAAAVDDLDALAPNTDEADFEKLARSVHDSINAGEPEVGLDRLHTFVSKFVEVLAEREGVTVGRDDPLHSRFGVVVRAMRARAAIETDMADRILRSTISTMESFNAVRNDRTFAHPNRLLSFDEALLIFRHVASAVRFLKVVAVPAPSTAAAPADPDDDLPF